MNGPSGVGKTTVARLLAARASTGACVHGDSLREFVVRRENEVELGLTYVNAATVAANFVRGGYDRVVVDYVFEHPRHVVRFVDSFDAQADLHVVTLWATREALAARGGSLDGWERMRPALADLGELVDTTGRTPAGVVAAIEAAL